MAINKTEIGNNLEEIRNLLDIESTGDDYGDIFDHTLFGVHITKDNTALSDENPHICIGWSKLGDLSSITTKDELIQKFENTYPDKNKRSKSQDVGQIWRFINNAQIGDYVVLGEPSKFHIGRITSDYYYDVNNIEGQDNDYVNNHKVEWLLKNADRTILSSSLHYSLGSAMSFFTLNDYKAAIVAILKGTYKKDDDVVEDESFVEKEIDYDSCTRLSSGQNIILYGVPGAGKSYAIENEYCDEGTEMERVVFHPDYTYSDFVGQILPKSINGDVSYEFMPGPFTKIVRDAYRNPMKKYILVIEEINRGNAPAIFGDIFQLLDRDGRKQIKDKDGNLFANVNYCGSSYGIINADVAKIIYGNEAHQVKIPSNMSIICTMNTSDQNVFTLDTAFQRRWNMRLIENTFRKETKEEKLFAEKLILDTHITWEDFCEVMNTHILEKNQNMTSSEDKRLGTHFVSMEDLTYSDETKGSAVEQREAKLNNRRFPEKVLKYLWDDAFKFTRDQVFEEGYDSLEKVIKAFVSNKGDDRFVVFHKNVKPDIMAKLKASQE